MAHVSLSTPNVDNHRFQQRLDQQMSGCAGNGGHLSLASFSMLTAAAVAWVNIF